ncbi:DUF2971 domain-containing protein [Arenibacter sp. M-2]|uniref:DUF2971 domain-containing protein n=1 Tax=Arenibacter sp. M-2 TaxID=3053612 RepID=UPI00257046C4|nr:DUF2971 domain-containing protein [Arenibacter sp. M-2]MDL5514603.1 DUF2971 domain-containing protein [Arenibacter sp. M-2]
MYELEVLKEKFPIKMGQPHVFRFRQANKYTLSELDEGYIWFSSRDSLNDPLDSNPEFVKLSSDFKEQKLLYDTIADSLLDVGTKRYFDENMDATRLIEFAQTKVEPFVNSFGIACFTMYPMNEKLWEIYAGNHSGLSLHFDINLDKKFFHNVLPIYYIPEIRTREYNPISEPDHIVDLFYKKTEDWSYEKELRLLKDRTGRIPFNRESLQNIIIGPDTKKDFMEQIIEIAKEKYPNVNVYQTVKPVVTNNFKCNLLHGSV